MRAVRAVVPAAGLCIRMGGPNKLLLPWRDTTVIGSVVRTLSSCGLEVLVVTGRDADQVAAAASPARAVFNPDFAQGLAGSIAVGVRACPESDGYLIALGDMPDIDQKAIEELLQAFEEALLDAIFVPIYEREPDHPGHPVLFGSEHRQALTELEGHHGARSILDSQQAKIVFLSLPGHLPGIDRPEDLPVT